MPAAVPVERARVLAVVRALKAVGVRVRNWKNFLHEEKSPEQTAVQEYEQRVFAFGRDLKLLPQQQVDEVAGEVPLFLVEACAYLSLHLHTEGLFRKTGSLSRIRTLRTYLEKGEHIFLPPHSSLLQPCDVASMLKQFLRELPEPLITGELQVALCQAQTLQEGARERATLLLTLLLHPANVHTLRFVCSFLQQVAHRCDENRMEVSSLALVMAPNLLQCSAQTCRLNVHTEKQLDQQAAAISSLILHAEHIGIIPACVMESLGLTEASNCTPPPEGAVLSKRTRLSVYSNMSRQRRRSVGEIFVDAFSKLKSGRTLTGPSVYLDASSGSVFSKSPCPHSPSTVKRKATEENISELDGSAKKRRSVHDLRDEAPPISSHAAGDEPAATSPQSVKRNTETQHSVSKRRSHICSHRKSHRTPKQEVNHRRRSLRFFTTSSNSTPVLHVSQLNSPEKNLISSENHQDVVKASSYSDSTLKIPFILIEEPGRVVIGSEVDDDPDLLNCSFVENLDLIHSSDCEETIREIPQQENVKVCDEPWVLLEVGKSEVIVECDKTQNEAIREEVEISVQEKTKSDKNRTSLAKRPRPRRSISMPEVTLEGHSDEPGEAKQNLGTAEEPLHSDVWSSSVSLLLKRKQKEGREGRRRRYGTVHEPKKDKDSESCIKKQNSRPSMVERFRSFSALASFLRTPTVRLRRQGARRFSRSFSDEGVRDDQQAFLELNNDILDPEEPQSSPPLTPAATVQDLSTTGPPQKSDENRQVSAAQFQGVVPTIEVFDLDTMFEQKCHFTESHHEPEKSADISDVLTERSTLMDQQEASFTSSVDSQLGLHPSMCTPSDQQRASLISSVDSSSQCCSTYEMSPCKTMDCLSFDGVFSISSMSDRCSLSLELSPPSFQFRSQATRRHYRDSPRWPTQEVRMTTWKPLPF